MRHLLLIPVLGFGGLLAHSFLEQKAAPEPDRAAVFLPQSAEVPGNALLDQVIASLSPERVQWLRMTIVQKMIEENFQTEGHYVLAPGQRLRLEMKVKGNDVAGNVLVVSDGVELFKARWSEGAQPRAIKKSLPDGDPALDPKSRRELRDGFLHDAGYGGLLPLLKQIREHLEEPVQQAGVCQSRKAIRLYGAWNADENALKKLPAHWRARQCALYLDAESLWPFRIEWIGAPRPRDPLVVLMRMDFRDAVINQPMTDAEIATAFHFPYECADEATLIAREKDKLRVDEEASFGEK